VKGMIFKEVHFQVDLKVGHVFDVTDSRQRHATSMTYSRSRL
jgi:hypothetical protein